MRLIDADALEKTLRDWIRDHWTEAFTGDDAGAEFADMIEHAETIDAVPSAQPERKKGKWIEISSISHTYKCSECGRLLVNITDGKNNVARNYPYCHCGADMRGEQE